MRSRGGDGYEGRSDAASCRSEDDTVRSEKQSRFGSQRSGNDDYGSDSSSSRNPIEYTEQERAELLRRLDSIKDHLLRGGDKAKDADTPFLRPIHLTAPSNPNHPGPSSYYHPYPEPFPVHGMYPQGYQDPYGYQIHRRPPPIPNPSWYPHGHYPAQMARPYHGGQYVDIGPDILDPHSYYPATPTRYSDMPPYSPVSSHHRSEKLSTPFSPPVGNYNNSPSFPSSMSSPGPRGGYARWPSDLDSEMGGGAFARGYVKKAVSDSDARRCHPLAGGAPFIACCSCFELLYLPKKKLLAQDTHHKLQCGSCSQVISFSIVDKKLVFSSANEETKPVQHTLVVEKLSSVDLKKLSPRKDEEESTQELRRNHQEDTRQSIRSESQHSYDEERLSVSSEQEAKDVRSVRRRAKGGSKKALEAATPESASLLELFEYSNVNRAALAYGMAQLGYSKPDKQESLMRGEVLKPEAVDTETEVSYNGYSNTEISEESNGKEDKSRPRSSECGSAEMRTRSSGDGNEDEGKSLEVWVNGHHIPEELVCSAEKLAGPIQAGKYWYDYRAGFWGVMGKPCLGIIPPFIEEFSHPMPDNCGAGDTQVYVNGRELNTRDLKLLVGRGLPRDKNRSYILDISGRILDGDSGEELKSLGKLAPTVEKVKHGFGMRAPRSLLSASHE